MFHDIGKLLVSTEFSQLMRTTTLDLGVLHSGRIPPKTIVCFAVLLVLFLGHTFCDLVIGEEWVDPRFPDKGIAVASPLRGTLVRVGLEWSVAESSLCSKAQIHRGSWSKCQCPPQCLLRRQLK
eukprot:323108-Amphidinium_carterae.1